MAVYTETRSLTKCREYLSVVCSSTNRTSMSPLHQGHLKLCSEHDRAMEVINSWQSSWSACDQHTVKSVMILAWGGGGDSWVSAPSWGAVGSWRLLGESQSSLRVWPLVGQPGSCGRLHPKNMWVAQNGLSGLLFFLKKGKQGGCLKWGGLGDTSGWGWSWGNAANMTQIHCKKFSRN